MSGFRPAIVGIAGTTLSPAEAELFAAEPPAGFILFARNCRDPGQLRQLVGALRALFPGRHVSVLIDQEGGRVQRLGPPGWAALPAPARLGDLAVREPALGERAVSLQAEAIACQLAPLGIDVACAPVLDLRLAETTAAIGDRSFGADPDLVARLGRRFVDTLLAHGVVPVIKHLPGHGRARVDSHVALPIVDAPEELLARSDFVPFVACRDTPMGMTCHCLYPALDPDQPATLSRVIIGQIIRDRIGFRGLLLSDDLCMGALQGEPAHRALAALEAGVDLVLWCDGDLARTASVLRALPPASPALACRLEDLGRGLADRRRDGDAVAAVVSLAELLARHDA